MKQLVTQFVRGSGITIFQGQIPVISVSIDEQSPDFDGLEEIAGAINFLRSGSDAVQFVIANGPKASLWPNSALPLICELMGEERCWLFGRPSNLCDGRHAVLLFTTKSPNHRDCKLGKEKLPKEQRQTLQRRLTTAG